MPKSQNPGDFYDDGLIPRKEMRESHSYIPKNCTFYELQATEYWNHNIDLFDFNLPQDDTIAARKRRPDPNANPWLKGSAKNTGVSQADISLFLARLYGEMGEVPQVHHKQRSGIIDFLPRSFYTHGYDYGRLRLQGATQWGAKIERVVTCLKPINLNPCVNVAFSLDDMTREEQAKRKEVGDFANVTVVDERAVNLDLADYLNLSTHLGTTIKCPDELVGRRLYAYKVGDKVVCLGCDLEMKLKFTELTHIKFGVKQKQYKDPFEIG